MAARRKVLTGSRMNIPIGGTLLSKMGYTPDANDVVNSVDVRFHPPAVEGVSDEHGKAMLEKLGAAERSLVMRALYLEGECTAGALNRFSSLPPGIRELKVRKAIDSVWTDGRWRGEPQFRDGKLVSRAGAIGAEMAEMEDAYQRILPLLGLSPPTAEEKASALVPAELTQNQRLFLSLAPEEGSKDGIARFRQWVAGLKDTARESLWRSAGSHVVSAASLVHKLRFRSKLDLTSDELKVVSSLGHTSTRGVPDLSGLKKAFSEGFKRDPETLEAVRAVVGSDARQGLLASARACAEYRTLLDFLGIANQSVRSALRPERGICKGCTNMEGNHSTNDDSFLSLDLMLGSKTVRLDAVFDGLSGYQGGYVASGMAKEVFETAALAGWISGPEDARFGIILADLVIQLEKKGRRIPKMGTTATISYLDGRDLFVIHCGDSSIKVVTGQGVAYSTTPHGVGSQLWSGLGIGVSVVTVNDSTDSRYKPISVAPGSWVLLFTDGVGDVVCDHELPIALKKARTSRKAANEIFSIADARRDRSKEYPPLCGCEPIEGKDDDIAIIAVYVE